MSNLRVVVLLLLAAAIPTPAAAELVVRKSLRVPDMTREELRLETGETVQVSVHVSEPSRLPTNARLRVRWRLLKADSPIPRASAAAWTKLLHALDPDVYLVYRAPTAGIYELNVTPETQDVTLFQGERWRESGAAPRAYPVPRQIAWPADAVATIAVAIESVDLSGGARLGIDVECEPNDTPEQAQPIELPPISDDFSVQVVGSGDDIEYFDNGRVGASGDDWFRVDFRGPEKRLLTACLSIPDQQVAARIRCYVVDGDDSSDDERGATGSRPVEQLAVTEYEDGKNPNERTHQQDEQHRIAINRWVEPGRAYLIRVEANAPGYELEIRVVKPAPFDDPRRAIRHGLYDHIGQVDAWLTNRPRGASVERRIRDSGNLLGTNCMSCHTQSGVWGPAVPFALGYRPQNIQPWRHLINTCYQSMRPTNHLVDAANNTSLPPLDLGDGPAGTRVAGHAVVTLERFMKARKLQSKQAIRAANFVLQSSDPGGINAAGPGANVGRGVVFNYAGEILFTAWKTTGDEKYLRALEEKVRKVLAVEPKYADDLEHRVEFLRRFFPSDGGGSDGGGELAEQARKQIDRDLARLRAIQLVGGGWSFDPGSSSDGGTTWTVKDTAIDPSPTALALIAFEATGLGPDDPTVSKGVRALLGIQHPTGYWNGKSKTGFVSTSYAVHALARLFPTEAPRRTRGDFTPREGESLLETIRRVRGLSMTEDPEYVDLLIEAAGHASPLVRYWAMIGLGATHTDAGVQPIVGALGDPVKMVREAAHWGLRQTLIDDRGWDHVFAALETGDDTTRETAMRALVMKVDGVLPESSVGWDRLAEAFDRGLNDDPHPGVRAWASKAAWQWWVWNPPIRKRLNEAWIRMLSRPETNALVENTIRYQSHALFIANGHNANASKEHHYKELGELFESIHGLLKTATKENPALGKRLSSRLVAVASTFYGTKGGDGGPGQMGYVTAGAGDLFGEALLLHFDRVESSESNDSRYDTDLQLTLEAAANIPQRELQQKLTNYSLEGPEKFRGLAASSLSDPRLVQLAAVAEQLEPMHAQLIRGALEPPRRAQLSDPLLKLFRRVRWLVSDELGVRQSLLQYLVPDVSAYRAKEEIETIEDAAKKAEASRWHDGGWYLASGMGLAFAENPDLQFDALAEALPKTFRNPAEAQLWLRSVPWILTFKNALPEVDPANVLPPIDPYEELKSRALRLFLTQLTEAADGRNRTEAVALANKTALRRNPEVHTALDALLKFEKDKEVVKTATNVLSTNRQSFQKDLVAAVKKEGRDDCLIDDAGDRVLKPAFVADFSYFRDYVVPELSHVLRTDERGCMACHGKPGRTPMDLAPPDDVGFLPVDKLLANYRTLQARIDPRDIERSKLLRKPLNVQTGKEDGHQGGRRYMPNDAGYRILRQWVLNQKGLIKAKVRVQSF